MGQLVSKSKEMEIQHIKKELYVTLLNYKTKYIEVVNRINAKKDCIITRKEESVLFSKIDLLVNKLKNLDDREQFDYFMNFYANFLNLKKSRYFKVDMDFNIKEIDMMINSPLLSNPAEK